MASPLDSLNLGQLKAEVEVALNDVESLLAFVEKFSFLLPAQAKIGITDLQTVLNVVQSFLNKV